MKISDNFDEISHIGDRQNETGRRKMDEAIFRKILASLAKILDFYEFINDFANFLVRSTPNQTSQRAVQP